MKQNAQLMPMIRWTLLTRREPSMLKIWLQPSDGNARQRWPARFLHRNARRREGDAYAANGEDWGIGLTSSKRPVEIYLEVDDVNAYHDRVKKNGVRITTPLTDQWWVIVPLRSWTHLAIKFGFIRPLARSSCPRGQDRLRTDTMKKGCSGGASVRSRDVRHAGALTLRCKTRRIMPPSHICVLTPSFHSASRRC